MSIFVVFDVLLKFLNGLAMLLTGLLIWRRFKDDFETRTLGGILALISIIFFQMSLRNILWAVVRIEENVARDIFSAGYILILFLLLPFALPRFLYLISNKEKAKRVGLVSGIMLFVIYLVIHFSQREKIITHHAPKGLMFEPPYLEKIFLISVFVLFLPMVIYRVGFHFHQWRKTKIFPYKLLNYLLLFFVGFLSLFSVLRTMDPWLEGFLFSFSLAGVLGIYFISSQELIKKEELVAIPEKEGAIEVPANELERLSKLMAGLKREMEESRAQMEKLEQELKSLKRGRK